MALSGDTHRRLEMALRSNSAADEIGTVCDTVDELTATEIGYVDGITPGTAYASKAVVLNSSKGVTTITSATITTLTTTTVVMTGTTGAQEIQLTTNLGDALSIEDGSGDLVVITTTTNAQAVALHKNVALTLGAFAATYATGSGYLVSATMTAAASVFCETTADITSAYMTRAIRGRHLVVTSSGTINQETYGIQGQLAVKGTTLAHIHAGILGTLEVSTAMTSNGAYTYSVGCIIGRLGTGTSITIASKPVCGVIAMYNAGALSSGSAFGFACTSTTATTWTAALALDKCDAVFYAATATAYESGIKALAKKLDASNTTHAVKISIGGTPAYIPAFAAEWNS